MEEEARMILKQALVKKPPRYGLGTGCISTSPSSAASSWRSHRVIVPPRIVTFDDEDDNA